MPERKDEYMRRWAATAAVIGWMGVAATGANAQDGKALLEKTLKAYHDLGSYSGKLSTDIIAVTARGRQALGAVSADMLYKRPNKLFLKVSSRSSETDVYSDGGKMVVYLENFKKYSTGSTAPNLNALMPLLRERAGIDSMLDPLYFLNATSLPAQLTNIKVQSGANVNGRPVSVVSGSWTGDTPAYAAKNLFMRRGARWTLYVDKANFLLQKVEAQIPGMVQQRMKQKDGKIVNARLAITLTMRASVIDPRPNPPADDRAFQFTPPPGATEQKSVKDLLNTPAK